MNPFIFLAANETDTDRLGQALAAAAEPGTTIALIGTLGAGKTRLTQGVAAALGIDRRDVLSPTFVLGQHYQGRRTIHHFDLYRLKDDDEFLNLGPEEYFESDGLTFVEWGDKFPACLPADRVEIVIRVTSEEGREFVIRGWGVKSVACVERLRALLP